MHENKEDIKGLEEDIKLLLDEVKFDAEWLKLKKDELELNKKFEDDPDIGDMAKEETKEIKERIEQAKAAIETTKNWLAKFISDKAEFQAYGDELEKLERETSETIQSILGSFSGKN